MDIAEVIGTVVQADVVEGRFGLLTKNNVATYDFGSRGDLPGWKVPATADEAEAARYVITWPVSNSKPPYMVPQPNVGNSLRYGGFDKAANLPASNVTVFYTYPGFQDSVTIPSGSPALAYAGGTFTVPSGQYIYNVALKSPGAPVIVANTAEDTTDAGKPKYQSSFDGRVIGVVEYFDTSTYDLTIRAK
jgi:hypothetical protein